MTRAQMLQGYGTYAPSGWSTELRSNWPMIVATGDVLVSHTCTLKIQLAANHTFLVIVIALMPPATACTRRAAPSWSRGPASPVQVAHDDSSATTGSVGWKNARRRSFDVFAAGASTPRVSAADSSNAYVSSPSSVSVATPMASVAALAVVRNTWRSPAATNSREWLIVGGPGSPPVSCAHPGAQTSGVPAHPASPSRSNAASRPSAHPTNTRWSATTGAPWTANPVACVRHRGAQFAGSAHAVGAMSYACTEPSSDAATTMPSRTAKAAWTGLPASADHMGVQTTGAAVQLVMPVAS